MQNLSQKSNSGSPASGSPASGSPASGSPFVPVKKPAGGYTAKGFKATRLLKWLFAFCAVMFITGVLALNLLFPFRFSGLVHKYSAAYGVDSRLVYAVIWTESKFKKDAVSPAGAVGLMQLMPLTAEWCCQMTGESYDYDRLFEPELNIKLGTYYLSYLIGKYGEDAATAAYNAGEGNLSLWEDGEIRFEETKQYIKRVGLVKKIYAFKTG